MMDYREILRLRSLGFSQRQLEREKIVGREKSKEIYQAADRVGIHWPLDDDVTNEELELLLFPGKYSAVSMYVEPDYPYIHRELAKHGVTLTSAIAYPYGAYIAATAETAGELGFRAGFTCEEKVNLLTGDAQELMTLGRYNRPHGAKGEAVFAQWEEN